MQADLGDPTSLPATLVGIHTVIDCATARPEEPSAKIDWVGKKSLIQCAQVCTSFGTAALPAEHAHRRFLLALGWRCCLHAWMLPQTARHHVAIGPKQTAGSMSFAVAACKRAGFHHPRLFTDCAGDL